MGFLLAAVVSWVAVNAGALREYIQAYEARNREQERIDELQQRIRILIKQQRGLKYNGFEAERRARERLGLHKPGEQVIYLKPATAEASTSPVIQLPVDDTAKRSAPSSPTQAVTADTSASRPSGGRKNPRAN